MNIGVVFYSLYGHVAKLAKSIGEGAREVKGVKVGLYQVPETLPADIIEKLGGAETRKEFAHVPTATISMLPGFDAIIFGTPTRFGNMCAQMKAFIDATGVLWMKGALTGKVTGVFTSSATQHQGQESTILSFYPPLLHHGMIICGVPNTEARLGEIGEISGGSVYGASTIAGQDGSRQPTINELAIAKAQGRYVAEITAALVKGRKTQ